MATNLLPADELASVRRRIADLKARESVLRKIILGDETLKIGHVSEIKVAVINRKQLDRRAVAKEGIDLSPFETSVTVIQLRVINKEPSNG